MLLFLLTNVYLYGILYIPHGVYIRRNKMEHKNHIDDNILKRLSRIEGQIRGIKEMGTSGRPCSDILIQLSAVQNALTQVSKLVMLDHIEHCVVEGLQTGEISSTMDDLKTVVDQFSKMR